MQTEYCLICANRLLFHRIKSAEGNKSIKYLLNCTRLKICHQWHFTLRKQQPGAASHWPKSSYFKCGSSHPHPASPREGCGIGTVPNKPKTWASFWLAYGLSVGLGPSRADRHQNQCSWSRWGRLGETCWVLLKGNFRDHGSPAFPCGSFFNPLMPCSKLLKQSLVTNYILLLLWLWLYVTWSQAGVGHRSRLVEGWCIPAATPTRSSSPTSVSYYNTTFSSHLTIQKNSVKKNIFKLTFEIMAAHSLSPTRLMERSLFPLKFY